jgi:putative endonuclease
MRGEQSSAGQRRQRLRAGRWAENLAALYLLTKGYRILARRWRTRAGEIDIVARRGNRLAFVEVKQRLTTEDAEAAISGTQRQRILNAADDWLSRNPQHQTYDIGFDVVFMVRRSWPRHIENGL